MGIKITTPAAPKAPVPRIKQPGRSLPAPKPRTPACAKPSSTPARATKSPQAYFKMEDPRLALMCAPGDFLDCTQAHDVLRDDLVGRPSTLLALRSTGVARGYSASKQVLWSIPSSRYPSARDLQFWQLRQARRVEIDLSDGAGQSLSLSVFGMASGWLDMPAGEEVFVVGELAQYGRRLYLSLERRVPAHAVGRVWSRYSGVPGQVSGEKVEAFVEQALQDESSIRVCAALVLGETGMSEGALMQAAASHDGSGFDSVGGLMLALHRPISVEQGRLALECARRLSALAIQAAALRHHSRPAHPRAPLPLDLGDIERLAGALPHRLTASQIEVATTVARRMTEPKPLSALLSGDVGTGKTLAFLLPAVAAHRAGARVAIVTPRTLLADQIAQQLLAHFADAQIERVNAGGKINDPGAIIVSTPGLATIAQKQGYVPNFLVCDEQHKFSASAREALVGVSTHLLEVSATPVPRSLAASLYDGLEILNLRECPVEKTIASTIVDKATNGASVIAAIRGALARGERAAMVYPIVADAQDSTGRQSVESAFSSLSAAFPGKVTMLHGELSDEEIRQNVQRLRSGECPLVIASTVLEIGIDIPSVSVMAVRDADCFGISQLHQLRGRLVRNGGHGDFMMVVESIAELNEETLARLQAVARTTDGYELAELDLVQRGFGNVDGTQQTGDSRTLFRQIRLGARDFIARKLKTSALPMAEIQLSRAPATAALETPAIPRYRQERLL